MEECTTEELLVISAVLDPGFAPFGCPDEICELLRSTLIDRVQTEIFDGINSRSLSGENAANCAEARGGGMSGGQDGSAGACGVS